MQQSCRAFQILSENEKCFEMGSCLTLLRAKNRRKSVNNVSLGIKTTFFEILNCGGGAKKKWVGGWGFMTVDDWLIRGCKK